MDAKLVLLGDKSKPTVLSLRKLPITLGRGREAGLTVAHPMISRQHCEFYEVENTLCIRDLNSLNGTFVGGIRIEEASLESGDVLMIGSTEFEVVVDHDQALMPPAHPLEEAKTSIGMKIDADLSEVDVDFKPADQLSDDFSDILESVGVGPPAPMPEPTAATASPTPTAASKPTPEAATKPTPTVATKPTPTPKPTPPAKQSAPTPAGAKPAAKQSVKKTPVAEKPTKAPNSNKGVKTKKVSGSKTISFDAVGDAAPGVEPDDDLNDFLAGLQ